jgi:hypothetical protein
MLKLQVIFSLLFVLTTTNLLSQGGSNYSLFGFGDVRSVTGATYDARAGTSIGVISKHGINLSNPALLGYGEFTRMQVGFRFNQHLNVPQEGNSVAQFNSKLDGFSALFMIDTASKSSFSLGIHPSTSINYRASTEFKDTIADVPIRSKTFFEGAGGITNAYIAGSYSPIQDFTVGVYLAALLGNSTRSVQTDIIGEDVFSSFNRIEDVYRGTTANIGFVYTGIDNLTIGAKYSVTSNIQTTSTIRYTYYLLPDTTFTQINSEPFPSMLGIGLGYSFGDYAIAADFERADYSSITYRRPEGTTFGAMQRISASFSKNGSRRFSVPYSEKLGYHFGIGQTSHFASLQGNPISDLYASFGMDIPFGDAIFNVATVAGTRGSSLSSSVREYYSKFTFTLSIGETWFQPFKREQY